MQVHYFLVSSIAVFVANNSLIEGLLVNPKKTKHFHQHGTMLIYGDSRLPHVTAIPPTNDKIDLAVSFPRRLIKQLEPSLKLATPPSREILKRNSRKGQKEDRNDESKMVRRPKLALERNEIAWPTVFLTASVLTAQKAVITRALHGRLPLPLAAALLSVATYYGFTCVHEAAHDNVARGGPNSRHLRWMSGLVGHMIAPFLCLSYSTFRANHLDHHAHVNQPELDVDHWVLDTTTHLESLIRCMLILPRYHFVLLKSFCKANRRRKRETLQGLAEQAAMVGAWVKLFSMGFAKQTLMMATMVIINLGYLVHKGVEGTDRWNHSRMWRASHPLKQLLLSLYFMGHDYHFLHHHKPKVPFYRYAGLERQLRPTIQAHGVQVVPTI